MESKLYVKNIFLLASSILMVGCFAVPEDGLSISKTPITPSDPSGWVLSSPSRLNAKSEINKPVIAASGLTGLDGSKIEVYLDSECTVIKGSAKISNESFSVTDIEIPDSFENAGVKKFYGKIISIDNISSNCVDLGISYEFFPKSQLPLFGPVSVALNSSSTNAYVVDEDTGSLYEIDVSTGKRTVLSSASVGTGPSLAEPIGLSLNNDETKAFVLDDDASALYEIDLATGNRRVVSDDSTGTGSGFSSPKAVRLNSSETKAYVIDSFANALIEVDLATGNRSIVSNSSNGTGSVFNDGRSLAFNSTETKAYVADRFSDALFEIDMATGNRIIISNSSTGTGSNFSDPRGAVLNSEDTIAYVLDVGADAIFKVDLSNGNRTILSNSSFGSGENFSNLKDIAINSTGSQVYLVDDDLDVLFTVDLSNGDRSIASESSVGTGTSFSDPVNLVLNAAGTKAYMLDDNNFAESYLVEIDLTTGDRSLVSSSARGTGTSFSRATGLALNPSETTAYVADYNQDAIIEVDLATGNRTPFSNSSNGSGPNLTLPTKIILNNAGSKAYVLDGQFSTSAVFEIDMATGNRTLVASSSRGTGTDLAGPKGIALNTAETKAYVIDNSFSADRLFEVDLTTGNRIILSDSSTGTGTNFSLPLALAYNPSDEDIYVADSGLSQLGVFKVNLSSGNRSFVSSSTIGAGPGFIYPNAIVLNSDSTKAYVLDKEAAALFEVDMQTGDRKILSRSR